MNLSQAILLGVIQGLTEFLPVSSSGHLVIAENYLAVLQPQLAVVWLHFATLLAVFFFFREQLLKMKWREWRNVLLATLPALVGGWFLKDALLVKFGSLAWVGFALILTGLINFLIHVRLKQKPKHRDSQLRAEHWLTIGLFQAFALLPGISRSGSTILGSLMTGLDRQSAFRFSFILSIPAILLASSYELWRLLGSGQLAEVSWLTMVVASLTAAVLGYVSLTVMVRMLDKAKWWWFGVYSVAVGLILVWFNF